jgi:hypothetical protein
MHRVFVPVITAMLLLFLSGCSTAGHFKIPTDTSLKVAGRAVTPRADGRWETKPFFWNTAGGAHYDLFDASGALVRRGSLKTTFRVTSIFWPPFAIIYWPMGLSGEYDLTVAGDGYRVRDESGGARVTPTSQKKNE